jgi:hypothetical protein
MGNFAPSNRDNELRIEKLFLRKELKAKLDSGVPLVLDDFMGFFWHMGPADLTEHTRYFLKELIRCRREGRAYTEDDWIRFKEVCRSGNNRNIILTKLLHLGIIERKNKSRYQYEIIVSDKWIEYLRYLIEEWVMLTR